MTRSQALADLADRNVITEARLVDARVRTEDDYAAAKNEAIAAKLRVAAEFAGLTA